MTFRVSSVCAARSGHVGTRSTVVALLKAKAECNLNVIAGKPIVEAARYGCAGSVIALLTSKQTCAPKPTLKSHGGHGCITPLEDAARNGHTDAVRVLMRAKANFDGNSTQCLSVHKISASSRPRARLGFFFRRFCKRFFKPPSRRLVSVEVTFEMASCVFLNFALLTFEYFYVGVRSEASFALVVFVVSLGGPSRRLQFRRLGACAQ